MGHSIAVVNIHTLKPFDSEIVLRLAQEYGLCASVEDHYITGGLGSAVAESLAEAGASAPLLRLGVNTYGESGTPEAAPKIQTAIQKFLN
jgi:transketolase